MFCCVIRTQSAPPVLQRKRAIYPEITDWGYVRSPPADHIGADRHAANETKYTSLDAMD